VVSPTQLGTQLGEVVSLTSAVQRKRKK